MYHICHTQPYANFWGAIITIECVTVRAETVHDSVTVFRFRQKTSSLYKIIVNCPCPFYLWFQKSQYHHVRVKINDQWSMINDQWSFILSKLAVATQRMILAAPPKQPPTPSGEDWRTKLPLQTAVVFDRSNYFGGQWIFHDGYGGMVGRARGYWWGEGDLGVWSQGTTTTTTQCRGHSRNNQLQSQ